MRTTLPSKKSFTAYEKCEKCVLGHTFQTTSEVAAMRVASKMFTALEEVTLALHFFQPFASATVRQKSCKLTKKPKMLKIYTVFS